MFFFGKSDIGKRRSTNQDSFNITSLPDGSFLCTVCDGMGGANGGNIASELASGVYADYVQEHIKDATDNRPELLYRAVAEANTAVFEKAASDEALNGMGTTLVSALIDKNGDTTVINVGDSRMYYLENGNLTQITRDHSYVQHLVDIGQITVKEAENASIKNIIIRSVGNEKKANPDLFTLKLAPDSYILLCSDGLTNCLDNDTIVKNISASTKEELASCVDNLINLANNAGGPDNITVILGKI